MSIDDFLLGSVCFEINPVREPISEVPACQPGLVQTSLSRADLVMHVMEKADLDCPGYTQVCAVNDATGKAVVGVLTVSSDTTQLPEAELFDVVLGLMNAVFQFNDASWLQTKRVLTDTDEHCVQTDTSGACVTCASGYFIGASRCRKSVPRCSAYDSATWACRQCNSGCLLQSGACVIETPNCAEYDLVTQQCHKCQPGFIFKSGL